MTITATATDPLADARARQRRHIAAHQQAIVEGIETGELDPNGDDARGIDPDQINDFTAEDYL